MRAAMRSTRPLCCVSVRVLRAYIYNALFTTAKPPKIRLSLSLSLSFSLLLWLGLPLPFLPPYCPLFSRSSSSFFLLVSRFLLYERRSWPTQHCTPSSHFLFLFIRSPSSHLRVLALTSRFSFVSVIDTRVNERDDWVLKKIRFMWLIFILTMLIYAILF